MDKQTLKTKIKAQAKQIAWRAITTVILTLTAVVTVWVYASFVEPAVGPNSSDQDFSQNILGNNDANNDFDSSSVVANPNGSIIERLEGIASSTCGNGIVESGEGCDDGGASWTSGACAGDCTRVNYWSNALMGTASLIPGDSYALNSYCMIHGFAKVTSFGSLISGTATNSTLYSGWHYYYAYDPCGDRSSYYTSWVYSGYTAGLTAAWGITTSLIAQSISAISSTYTTATGNNCWSYWYSYYTQYFAYVNQIWCAD